METNSFTKMITVKYSYVESINDLLHKSHDSVIVIQMLCQTCYPYYSHIIASIVFLTLNSIFNST